MPEDVSQAIGKVVAWAFREYVAPRLPDDEELNAAIAVLARALASKLDGLPAVPLPPPPPPPPVSPLPPPIPIAQLPPLNIGSQYQPPPNQQYWEGERELDLLSPQIVAERCRVKSDACKLIAKRVVDSFDWDDA